MKKKPSTQDQFYITLYHGKVKGGKTSNVYNRFGGSSYNVGGFNNAPMNVYFAVPSVVFPIDRLETLYEREFSEFLIPSKKNFRSLTEFIDPKYTNITTDIVKDAIEKFISTENLPIMKLKSKYLLTCQIDKDFVQKVRDDPAKYLDKI